jgi:Bacterial Ig-like domain (group 3)/FG-GAP-like repeat
MRRLIVFSALLLTLSGSSNLAAGQNAVTTVVTANPATITVGSTVGLTATVQPDRASGTGKTIARPTGTITFLDGSTPLSSSPIALTPNSYASATFPQTFGTPDPTLTGGEVTEDLNGDGTMDLLIYNFSPSFSAQTFTSNGKGGYTAGAVQTFSFLASAQYPYILNNPQLIDLNGDGKLDLLCGLLVAYGNGDGTFAQAVPVSFLSSGFVTSYAADLDGDGKTDIVAVPVIPQSSVGIDQLQFSVTVFMNQGSGSFTSTGTFPIAPLAFGSPYFLPPYVVDVNGDGKPDLITQTQTLAFGRGVGLQSVDVMLGNGDGTFGPYMPVSVPDPPDYGGGFSAYGTGYGDVNDDGKPDIILTLGSTEADLNAMVLLGNGDGTFQSPLYLALHTPQPGVGLPNYEAPSLVVEDLNLDGKQDLIFGNGQVALGNGDGTFVLSSPLFPLQLSASQETYVALPLQQVTLPGNLVPSLVYLLPTVAPPSASVFTPQTSSSATFSASALSVGAHAITARYSGDATYSADTSAAVAVTVNQAASATAITSSANPGFAGQSLTLTASVTSAGPTPTGNVTFTSGSTTLGTVALNGGSANFTTAFNTAGTQAITVSYSGDTNTQASSASLSQVVNDAFTLAPDGSGNTTLTVKAGQTVSAPINITGAAGFSGAVTFACSGLPANASCSFSPATINVSGTAAVPTLLSINTAASSMASQLTPGFGAYGLSLAGLFLLWPAWRRGGRVWVVLICAFTFAGLGLSGCSNGSGPAPAAQTSTGTYNFTVTATSGKVQTQSSYTLVVQ